MKNRDGVRQLGKGLYEVNFRPFPGADRIFRRVNVQSLQEARIKRAELLAESSRLGKPSELQRTRQDSDIIELQKVIENDLLSDNKGKKTINRFISCWKTFNQFLRKKYSDIVSINELKAGHFKDYQDYIVIEKQRKKGWRAELTILKAIFTRLRIRNYCTDDAIGELNKLKKPPRNKKHYEDIPDFAIREMLTFIDKDRPDYYGLTVLLYKCGWRIEETTLLRRADIEWQGLKPGSILIRGETTKTKVERRFDMFDDELALVIRRYAFDRKKTTWLFSNKQNGKIHAGHYREYLKKVSGNIMGKTITPHYFRHRLCTIAGRMNMPINDVMAITGIRDIKVLLEYYQHTTAEGKAKILALNSLK